MTTVSTASDIPAALKIKTSHYLIAASSLVVALTWNDVIKTSIRKVYPLEKDQVFPQFLFAMALTFILILVIFALPNTTSELPSTVQNKINNETNTQEIQELRNKMAQLSLINENLVFASRHPR